MQSIKTCHETFFSVLMESIKSSLFYVVKKINGPYVQDHLNTWMIFTFKLLHYIFLIIVCSLYSNVKWGKMQQIMINWSSKLLRFTGFLHHSGFAGLTILLYSLHSAGAKWILNGTNLHRFSYFTMIPHSAAV